MTRLPLCSAESIAAGEDPIGTAPHWAEVTVLELDVPVWARVRDADAWTPAQRDVFAALRERVEASGAGFGLLMSAPVTPGGPLRVRHYTLAGGGYVRQDYLSTWPQSEWARGLHDTLIDPANLRDWARPPAVPGPDLHVCTHGTVDAACGRAGIPVYRALQDAGVRAWRTGHFGGHRFAATAVDLPAGLLWAHLTPELAVQVARREVPPEHAARHLRGFAGLPPLAQVLDRHLLLQHGWSWLDRERRATLTAAPDGTRVTLHVGAPGDGSGDPATYRATVTAAPDLHLRGSSHDAARSRVPQYRLGPVEQLQPDAARSGP
ncbi:sucrase ferredoxin [Deinococcus aquiradiocola]|uniref:Sucrase ferredoxin n=1 Tax=Deinococcus aquiradiocola TaxID=393059 RepID=A0A917PGI2_9DEIO|nr:sucrase ferredoxin [Deinococcus aquiradiocola]GGJ77275.1 hypothetical protein GCM10008939_21700 [Deinococcus aquiradiocola]